MTDSPDFDLDTAISADIDGELANYASELGTDEPTVRQRITEDPTAAERRAALRGAHTAVSSPGQALDEITRARLVAGAMTQAPREAASAAARDRSWIMRAAVVAIAVIVVVSATVALFSRDGNDRNSASSGAKSGRSGNIGDIGNIDRQKLDELVGGPKSNTPAPRAETGGSASGSTATVDSTVRGFDENSSVRARQDQVAKCEEVLAAQGSVRFSGSGAYQGRAAVIVGVRASSRTIVFVVAADDCADILFSVSR